jgi:AraC family transcriptional regulator
MTPRIEIAGEKKLVGKRLAMSFADNKTAELWKNFMPVRHEIKNHTGTDLYSLQVYKPGFFNLFEPETVFEKWAAVETTDFYSIPQNMESFTLPAGLYAVFLYKGDITGASKMFKYIFETWLPQSGYRLDDRPHFELLGAKYQNAHPDSEEEIWIPIRQGE